MCLFIPGLETDGLFYKAHFFLGCVPEDQIRVEVGVDDVGGKGVGMLAMQGNLRQREVV